MCGRSAARTPSERQPPGRSVMRSVRERFSARRRPLAFLDGPGGTHCPDELISAIAAYVREDNANVGGAFATSVRTDIAL
jgi:selenocysteine lyase/cysteine desulfurase